jgi:hypothetical protein
VPSRIELLQALRLKGRATLTDLAAATAPPAGPFAAPAADGEELAPALAGLVEAGLCTTAGPRYKLTPAGRDELERGLRAERDALDPVALKAAYVRFEPLNQDFKTLVTDWQLKGGVTPNDHRDEGYDGQVIDRLGSLHERVRPFLEQLVELVPRLLPYPSRFARALGLVQAGEHGCLAGLSRATEAAAGRDA